MERPVDAKGMGADGVLLLKKKNLAGRFASP